MPVPDGTISDRAAMLLAALAKSRGEGSSTSASVASVVSAASQSHLQAMKTMSDAAVADAAADHVASIAPVDIFRHMRPVAPPLDPHTNASAASDALRMGASVGTELAVSPSRMAQHRPVADRRRDMSPHRRPGLHLHTAHAAPRGREGLPGGYRESRTMSPPQPLDLDQRRRAAARGHSPDASDAASSGDGTGKGAAGSKGGLAGEQVTTASSALNLAAAVREDAETQWCTDDLEEDVVELIINEDKKERRKLRKQAGQKILDELDLAVNGLVRCEHLALPHTVIAPYKDAWGEEEATPAERGDRSVKEVVHDAEAAVTEACKRLRRSMSNLLDEHTADRETMQSLEQKIDAQKEKTRAAEDTITELRNDMGELNAELCIAKKREGIMRDQLTDLQLANATMADTCQKYEKLLKEHLALTREYNTIARRIRAAHWRPSDDLLPPHKAQAVLTKSKKPAWVPPGGPFPGDAMVQEDAAYRPWTYDTHLSPRRIGQGD